MTAEHHTSPRFFSYSLWPTEQRQQTLVNENLDQGERVKIMGKVVFPTHTLRTSHSHEIFKMLWRWCGNFSHHHQELICNPLELLRLVLHNNFFSNHLKRSCARFYKNERWMSKIIARYFIRKSWPQLLIELRDDLSIMAQTKKNKRSTIFFLK